ncbi:L,D-transpeptidase [uncultured Alsobacter sp.]|uniref:L,D-transpeptidase n=1 Tax=uncultured Alsobacter sp. TaxID=1748258 RepID=UPI0025F15CC1|nr:L,D-transpeptidase [uncultured Alsobacter sp.]
MLTRRLVLLATAGAPLAACNTIPNPPAPSLTSDPELAAWYVGSKPDKPYDIPLVDKTKIDAQFRRQTVAYKGPEAKGTIVVDIDARMLYLVNGDGTAERYGAGVGRQGFSWRGRAYVGRKAVWPDWSPTSTMVRIKPELPRFLEAGLDNPLGARAMYLYQGGRDILFRIHGTNEPWSIGEQVSSGCIRLLNEDVADLYEKVPVGTNVLVKRNGVYRV